MLDPVQTGILPVPVHQFLVRSFLTDSSVFQYDDVSRIHDVPQGMGDDQHRLSGAQIGDGLMNTVFVPGVQRRCRLIQDHHRGVLQDRSGDAQALPFPSGEGPAVLRQDRIVSFRQFLDKLIASCQLRSAAHFLFGGIRVPDPDVVEDAVMEQDHILIHIGDLLVIVLRPDPAYIRAVHEDLSPVRIPEPRHQIGHGGLSRPRFPDDGSDVPDWLTLTPEDEIEDNAFTGEVNVGIEVEPLPEGLAGRKAVVRFSIRSVFPPSEPCARRVMELLNAKPETTLFVGDREDKDGASAKAVGARFLLIDDL